MAALGSATLNSIPTALNSGTSYGVVGSVYLGQGTGVYKMFDWKINPAVPVAGLIWPTGSPIIAKAITGRYLMREDTTALYSYIGTAPDGTADSSTGWSITRISMASPPVTTHATGIWNDRTTLTYT